MHPKLRELATSKTVSEQRETHFKFVQDGHAFQLKFANLRAFFAGLEGQIGPPETMVRLGMEGEHTTAAAKAAVTSTLRAFRSVEARYDVCDASVTLQLAKVGQEMRQHDKPSSERAFSVGIRIANLVQLHAMGFPISIFDWGLGHMALQMVSRGGEPGVREGKRGFADASAVGAGKTLTALATAVAVGAHLARSGARRSGVLVMLPSPGETAGNRNRAASGGRAFTPHAR